MTRNRPKWWPICPYCKEPAKLVGGQELYPHRKDLYSKKFYQCEPCEAHVGCHPNTEKPLGSMANSRLRKLRMAAHQSFDPIWKEHHWLSRREAYDWLAKELRISTDDCHIGKMNEDQCSMVTNLMSEVRKVMRDKFHQLIVNR